MVTKRLIENVPMLLMLIKDCKEVNATSYYTVTVIKAIEANTRKKDRYIHTYVLIDLCCCC